MSAQKKIQVMTFDSSAISGSTKFLGALGILLALSASAVGFVASLSTQEAEKVKQIASLVSASLARAGDQSSGMDSSEFLLLQDVQVAQSHLDAVNKTLLFSSEGRDAIAAVDASAASLLVSNASKAAFSAQTAQQSLRASLLDLVSIAQLLQAMPAPTSEAWLGAKESVTTLQSYSDSVSGLRNIERIDYYLRALASQTRAFEPLAGGRPEFRQLAAKVDSLTNGLLPLTTQARVGLGGRENLAKLSESVRTTARGFTNLGRFAETAKTVAAWGLMAAAVMLLGSLVLAVSAVRLIVGETGTRFKRATAQFRNNEDALNRLSETAKRMAAGETSAVANSEGTSDADIRDIANSLNKLTVTVRSAMTTVTRLGARAQDDTSLLSEACLNALRENEGQESSASEARETVALLGRTLEEIQVDAETCTNAAQTALDSVHQGKGSVRDAIEQMTAVRHTMQETTKRVKRLGERSQEASEVVEALGTLSEQINVLALNAALEAERAGEQGRGLTVVAAEVQRLSVRTEEALGKISGIVQAIQADTRDTTSAVEQATNQVVEGADVNERASGAFDVIKQLTESVAAMTASIALASRNTVAQAQTVGASAKVVFVGAEATSEKLKAVMSRVSGVSESITHIQDATRAHA